MAEKGIKPNRRLSGAATGWLSLLGVVAATAAVVLVPVVLDPNMLNTDPTRAYYQPELRLLLATSAVLVVTVLGVLIFGRGPFGVPVVVPALAFLGVSALSTLFSARPLHSFYGDRGEGLLSVAAGVLLFYTLARGLTSVSSVRLFLAAAVSAAAVISVFGIAQNYGLDPISGWGAAPFTDFGRSFATLGNSLTLAAYLTLMMGAATALWMGADSRARRAAWLLALATIGTCWIYAESRGAFLGVGVALPVVLLAVRRRMGTVLPLMVPIAVLVGTMVAAVAVSKASGFSTLSLRLSAVLLAYLALVGVFVWLLERGGARPALLLALVLLAGVGVTAFAATYSGNLTLADLGVTRAKASQDGDISMQTRLYTWRDTVPMILDRPLLGHGPDNYGESFRPYTSEKLRALISDDRGNVRILNRTHNHLLQIAATTGLLGLASYLWVLVSYFRNAYRRGGWVLAALSGGVLAYVAQIQTAFPSVATEAVFWGLLGASVALMRLYDRGTREDDEGGPQENADPSESPGKVRGELLVTAVVLGIIAVIAVPTFLEQRGKTVNNARTILAVDARRIADYYERVERANGTYPEPGVYTREKPVKNLEGRPSVRPSRGVTVTTKINPEDGVAVEARAIIVAGTFGYSYDTASERVTLYPDPKD